MSSLYVDLPCPYCGPSRKARINQARKVMRVYDHGGFKAFFCVRCESKGVFNGKIAIVPAPNRVEPDRSSVTKYLWDKAVSFIGTEAEAYMKSRKCDGPWPLRYLPSSKQHSPAMVAKFENGALHLTKFGHERTKIILGSCRGSFIKIREDAESQDLTITEGIEDACSVALQVGGEVWAAGFAGNIPMVANQAKHERVFIISDRDTAAKKALSRIIRDVIPVRVWRSSPYEDVNDALMAGSDIAKIFELSYLSHKLRNGEISFSRYQNEARKYHAFT